MALDSQSDSEGRKRGPSRRADRMAGLETAARYLGGQEALALGLGIGARTLRKKFTGDSPIDDAEMRATSVALHRRALQIFEHAQKLSRLITEQGNG